MKWSRPSLKRFSSSSWSNVAGSMGNLRATLIPTIAVPIVILGTFAVLGAFGFSINMLTMFAMVLAIGLLVERRHRGRGKRGANHARRRTFAPGSNGQIHGADHAGLDRHRPGPRGRLRPMAFFPGSNGVIYRQFSITIRHVHAPVRGRGLDSDTGALPSLLKRWPAGTRPPTGAVFFLRPFFQWFDRAFFGLRDRYVQMVAASLPEKSVNPGGFPPVIVIFPGIFFMRMSHGLSSR